MVLGTHMGYRQQASKKKKNKNNKQKEKLKQGRAK